MTVQDELLDPEVEVTDEELEDFLDWLFGPASMEDEGNDESI